MKTADRHLWSEAYPMNKTHAAAWNRLALQASLKEQKRSRDIFMSQLLPVYLKKTIT